MLCGALSQWQNSFAGADAAVATATTRTLLRLVIDLPGIMCCQTAPMELSVASFQAVINQHKQPPTRANFTGTMMPVAVPQPNTYTLTDWLCTKHATSLATFFLFFSNTCTHTYTCTIQQTSNTHTKLLLHSRWHRYKKIQKVKILTNPVP